MVKSARLLFVAALCGLAAPPAAAYLLIGQSFERETWPPPGWRIETRKPPMAFWARAYDGKRWFARGCVGGASGRGTAILITKRLYIPACSKITVTFDYKTSEDEYSWDIARVVSLEREHYGRFWAEHLRSDTWKAFRAELPPIEAYGEVYTFQWWVQAVTYSGAYVNLYVDNIRIEVTNSAVESTSLGRVKALYR